MVFIHPNIDPVALSLGPLNVHWYGLMYIVGFLGFLILGKRRARKPNSLFTPDQVDDMMFWGAIGVVAGGRIGYMLFYNFKSFAANPLSLFHITDGGMSFHGGLLGVLVVMAILAYRWRLHFFQVTDFIAPLVPIGLLAGRIGNFINGELWGHVTDAPWGVVFPTGGPEPRHPSMLYEAFLEGLVLFIVLNWMVRKLPPTGVMSGMFLVGYGLSRFIVEFVRVPDAHLGYIAFGWVTQGQILSLPMIILGSLFIVWGYKRGQANA